MSEYTEELARRRREETRMERIAKLLDDVWYGCDEQSEDHRAARMDLLLRFEADEHSKKEKTR